MLAQLFEPWANDLVSRARLEAGQSVLDVASGLGPVASRAAAVVGPQGRVVASDISAPMLARAAARPKGSGSHVIEYLECSAVALNLEDDSFDVVFCQQGLQFFADRATAVREMRRVVRPNGLVVISTWAADHPLGLFGPIAETLNDMKVDEPYANAYDPASYSMGASDLGELFTRSGLRDVSVETREIDAVWETPEEAICTLLGTPFGPLVTKLSLERQEQIRKALADRLVKSERGTVIIRTVSNTALGRK
ncbi:MAG TPA: class I SAM-dependent methyltransferase [Acidimicrobiales bacterium]